MDIIKSLQDGFDTTLRDIVVYVVAAFLIVLLTPLTLGILSGPMMVGFCRMVLRRVRDDIAPDVGDVFYFDRFITNVVAFYAIAILVSIGLALLVLPGLFLITIWLYAFPLLADERDGVFQVSGVGEALSRSKELVDEGGFSAHFGLAILLTLINCVLGSFAVGVLFSLPYLLATTSRAYTQAGELTGDLPSHGQIVAS